MDAEQQGLTEKPVVNVEAFSDEKLMQLVGSGRGYTVCVLRPGPHRFTDGWEQIIWEHARRNLALRAEGTLPIILRIGGDADIAGIGVFNTTLPEARDLIEGDPAIVAGILVYELYESQSFPGDSLPA